MLSTLCVLIHVILAILESRYFIPVLQMKISSPREDKAMLKVMQVARGEVELLIRVWLGSVVFDSYITQCEASSTKVPYNQWYFLST